VSLSAFPGRLKTVTSDLEFDAKLKASGSPTSRNFRDTSARDLPWTLFVKRPSESGLKTPTSLAAKSRLS